MRLGVGVGLRADDSFGEGVGVGRSVPGTLGVCCDACCGEDMWAGVLLTFGAAPSVVLTTEIVRASSPASVCDGVVMSSERRPALMG